MIRSLLIANRGEIAVRVIRACRELGIRSIAVFSEADQNAMHTQLADDAVALGGSEPRASYLDIGKVVDAAVTTGADAIHPGYGFLSERPEFVEACEAAGITFIGPSAVAMRRLGSKIDAKQLAVRAGVPTAPGFFEPGASLDTLAQECLQVGFPIMLKASAGGGGRGMRVVREAAELVPALEQASDEALKAFGDGSMMAERFVERPRHVEVQVIADSHGTVNCLFERNCSVQRRHQKLIEEAPSPWVAEDPLRWSGLREASERLVREAGYVGAGTVEFMVDDATGEFYFLEVNARLQVEHPVTEAVTGIDLVQDQIRVANGERLSSFDGDRSRLRGWAIEARIVAENPSQNFAPSIGPILGWAQPNLPGVRVDTGFGVGSEVSPYYDSLLAKVIASAETRDAAIRRLREALLDFHILGVRTNIEFLLAVLGSSEFQAGTIDTGWVGREFLPRWAGCNPDLEVVGALVKQSRPVGASLRSTKGSSSAGAWSVGDRFRVAKENIS